MDEAKWPPAPIETDRTAEYDAILDSERAKLKPHQASRARLYLLMKFRNESQLPFTECQEILDGYCERRGIPFEKMTPAGTRFACGAIAVVLLLVLALLGLVVMLLVVHTSVSHTEVERIAKERAQDLLIRMLIDLYVFLLLFALIARTIMWVNKRIAGAKKKL